jgi:phosphohistidine phosphatase SixA
MRLIIVRHGPNNWATKLVHDFQRNPILTSSGESIPAALNELLKRRPDAVVANVRKRIDAYNERDQRERRIANRLMGLRA